MALANRGEQMRILGKCAAIAALMAAMSGGTASGQTLKVGSKNLTEQFVVAELYAAALEASGFNVERKINLGTTLEAHEALVTGAIDIYPEYTGTALGAVLKVATDTYSQKEVYQRVKAYYEREFKLLWLRPSGVNNGYAMVLRPETAHAMNLKTLSDLAKVSKSLTLGAGPEFGERRDGIQGLKQVYGLEFGEYRRFAELQLRYKALMRKQIDIANGFATDWQIAADKLVALRDDKGLFPPYVLAPVVRMDTVASNAKAVDALERVGVLIDNSTMQELNRQVEFEKFSPRQVAEAFLKTKGLNH
jgi:osmoprotectant transport system substrate-binding protein